MANGKTSLSSALLKDAATGRAAPVTSQPDSQKVAAASPSTRTPAAKTKAHAGQINVGGYYPPEVKAAIRLVQAKTGRKERQLVGEALNDLFRKYDVVAAVPEDL